MNNQKPIAILAIDAERRGYSVIRHGMLALGWCLMEPTSMNVLDKGRIGLNKLYPGQGYEERTVKEFFALQPGLREKLEKEAWPPEDAMKFFYEKMVDWDSRYKLKIVSDNPFVEGWVVNHYLDHFGYPPMHFQALPNSLCGAYRHVYDTGSYSAGLMGWKYTDKHPKGSRQARIMQELGIAMTAKHDHLPDNDAEYIAEFHLRVMEHATSPMPRDVPRAMLVRVLRQAVGIVQEEMTEALTETNDKEHEQA